MEFTFIHRFIDIIDISNYRYSSITISIPILFDSSVKLFHVKRKNTRVSWPKVGSMRGSWKFESSLRDDFVLNEWNTEHGRSVASFSSQGPLVGRITVNRLFHLAVLLVLLLPFDSSTKRNSLEFFRARKFEVVSGSPLFFIDKTQSNNRLKMDKWDIKLSIKSAGEWFAGKSNGMRLLIPFFLHAPEFA